MNVRVFDEVGVHVSDVKVRFSFSSATNATTIVTVEGTTDNQGFFAGEGYTDGAFGCTIHKSGYYRGGFPFTPFRDAKDGRWQPWDSTYTSVLRKIENPVPMYAKNAWLTIPEIGKSCGYDLVEGDWVGPYGKGKKADFIFTTQSAFTNLQQQHVILNLSFSNLLDGIQQTELPKEYAYGEFIWPRQAPDNGYQSNWVQEHDKTYRIQKIEQQKFFFRVRTVEKDGKIVSALYGKLSEGFQVGANNPTNCMMRLCYYLNPTSLDRNMEFDLKQNLFKNLPQNEQPRRP